MIPVSKYQATYKSTHWTTKMARGAKPKPTTLKLIQGTAQKSRMNPNEPKPAKPAKVPAPPAHLSTQAKSEWKRIAKELHSTGILTKIDVKALGAYCQAFADMIRAEGLLAKWNLDHPDQVNIQRTLGGIDKTHPYVLQIREHRRDMVRFAAEFGLTPSSRTRVKAVGQGDGNEFDDF